VERQFFLLHLQGFALGLFAKTATLLRLDNAYRQLLSRFLLPPTINVGFTVQTVSVWDQRLDAKERIE